MAEQAWLSGDGTGGEFSAAPSAPPSPKAAYELRPLTTGEILDRTFYLYRSNFWLFVGLASIAAAVNTATSLVQVLYLHFVVARAGIGIAAPGATGALFKTFGIFAFAMVAGILYLAVYSVTQAATTSAVTAIYLGDATSIRQALANVKARWFRFILIGLWQIWSAMWLFFVLTIVGAGIAGGIAAVSRGNTTLAATAGVLVFVFIVAGLVYGVIAYIRNSFAVPAAVMEGLKVNKAMRRSKQLTSGTKGRIFLLYLFVLALYFVAIAIQSPISIIILQKKATQILLLQTISLFIGFFTGSVIGPVGAIGLCLFYIDQRIRREGFDIEFLLERSAPVPPFVSAPPPPLETPAPSLDAPIVPVSAPVIENP
jgi:hypothetical protein